MDTVIGILLFVVGLAVLITFHEFGHFLFAKIFGVYCYEFSVGFGKKIIRKKMKDNETYFSIGILPFGGYVSMYGEDDDEKDKKHPNSLNSDFVDTNNTTNTNEIAAEPAPNTKNYGWHVPDSVFENEIENLKLDEKRSLEGIAKPKKALVMSAGIIFNFVLGFIIYLLADLCFPYSTYICQLSSAEGYNTTFVSQLNEANKNLAENEYTYFYNEACYTIIEDEEDGTQSAAYRNCLSDEVYVNGNKEQKYLLFANANITYPTDLLDDLFYTSKANSDDKTYHLALYPYEVKDFQYENENKELKTIKNVNVYDTSKTFYSENPGEIVESIEVTFQIYKNDFELNSKGDIVGVSQDKENFVENYAEISGTLTYDKDTHKLTETGISLVQEHDRMLGWEAFPKAAGDFGNGCIAIFKSLGQIFTFQNLDQVGGIVALVAVTSEMYTKYSFSKYLSIWGLISVNLAVVNLIPFPGLDGWHLLVCVIEGISKKKLNKKFKKIASAVGLIVLFGLMAAILVVDILRYVFKVI